MSLRHVHSTTSRPEGPIVVLRDGLAVVVRLAGEPGLAAPATAWFERVLAEAPRPLEVGWVGTSTTRIEPMDARRLSACRKALGQAGARRGWFWIGGGDGPDDPEWVVGADLPAGGVATLRLRLPADWWSAVPDPLATLRRWLAGLPILYGHVAPSLHRGLGEDRLDHLVASRAALRPLLAAHRGWVPDDERGLVKADAVEHQGFVTLLGPALAARVALDGLDAAVHDGVTWVRAGEAPDPDGDPAAYGAVARALEPVLRLESRQPVKEWFLGKTSGDAEARSWLRRWTLTEAEWAKARRKLAG